MHEKILNYMLAHNSNWNRYTGQTVGEYYFDLGDLQVTVIAECLTPAPWTDETVPEYRILSYTVKDF